MAKEPHPNYDPDAIRLSLGVFGKLFEKGSPAGKLTLAFVGGVAVMGGFLWIANYLRTRSHSLTEALLLSSTLSVGNSC